MFQSTTIGPYIRGLQAQKPTPLEFLNVIQMENESKIVAGEIL
jgi:hypothetical protein